jgi:hypothetical protein
MSPHRHPLVGASSVTPASVGLSPVTVQLIAPGPRSPDIRSTSSTPTEGRPMTLDVVAIQPLVALIAGILILLVPRLLNYVIAIYLILIGLIGLWPHLLYRLPH